MMLGGDITVSSKPGKGSTFPLTVATGPLEGVPLLEHPQASDAGRRPRRRAASPRPTLDCRILLAEDGPDNQRLLSLRPQQGRRRGQLAENGQEAMERLGPSPAGDAARRPDAAVRS